MFLMVVYISFRVFVPDLEFPWLTLRSILMFGAENKLFKVSALGRRVNKTFFFYFLGSGVKNASVIHLPCTHGYGTTVDC